MNYDEWMRVLPFRVRLPPLLLLLIECALNEMKLYPRCARTSYTLRHVQHAKTHPGASCKISDASNSCKRQNAISNFVNFATEK